MTKPITPLTWLVDSMRAELIDAETTSNPLMKTRHIVRARKLLDEIQRHAAKDSDNDDVDDRSNSHGQV